jgi:hypothetical protein
MRRWYESGVTAHPDCFSCPNHSCRAPASDVASLRNTIIVMLLIIAGTWAFSGCLWRAKPEMSAW